MPFLLLTEWDGHTDMGGWLVSEKYDGHRALWTGRGFVSRKGHAVDAPAWFVAAMPAAVIDGELYSGAGHDEMQSIILSGLEDPRWAKVRFMVFDAPQVRGGKRERIAALPSLLAGAPFARVVEHAPVADAAEAMARMHTVVARGGEGVVACDSDAPYVDGRSSKAIKLKPGAGGCVRVAKQRTDDQGASSFTVAMNFDELAARALAGSV